MSHRLFVTGSTGLLGANLVVAGSARYDVVASHRQAAVIFPDTESVVLDITDAGEVAMVSSMVKPTVIVHCAAETRVDYCEDHPDAAMRVNVEGTSHLCRAAAATGALMLYVSTDSVFDGHRGGYTEEDDPRPLNMYARSKWLGEQVVRREAPDHLIVRTTMYGWNLAPKESLAEWILGRLRRGERVPGFVDVIFSPLLVNDLVDKLFSMIGRGLRGIYHLGARDSISKFEFARGIGRVFGLAPGLVDPVLVESRQLRARRPRLTSLNPSRVEKALGEPMPTVEEGLHRFRRLQESGYVASLRSMWLGAISPGELPRQGRRP